MSFLSNIFGSNNVQPTQINYPGPAGFSSPGNIGAFSGGAYNVGQTPQLSNLVGGLQQTFANQSNAYSGLLSTVQPGFSQLRQAGLAQLTNQQQSNVSNLRDTLAQRRILGSSFGQNQITQANSEFAASQANFIANSYLQELQASQSLIQQQYQAAAQSYQVGINQMNLDTETAAKLSQSATQVTEQAAQAQAYLDQQAATFNAQQQANSLGGLGKLFGTIFSAGTNSLGGSLLGSAFGAVGGMFGGQPTPTMADSGGAGIGSGGYNFIDAQAT